jgi:hypothetical protein
MKLSVLALSQSSISVLWQLCQAGYSHNIKNKLILEFINGFGGISSQEIL